MFDFAAIWIKALLYAGALTASGGVLFLAIFAAHLSEAERTRVVAFVRAAAVVALGLTLARIMVLSAMLADDAAGMWDWTLLRIILEGSEGEAAAARVAGLIAIAAFAFRTGLSQAFALAGALVVAASFALTGHTTAAGPGILPRILVVAHALGLAYWIGALVPLFMLARSSDFARVGAILKRFGDIAVFAVGGLIVAGLALLWLLLGGVEAIFVSAYGRFVLLKLAFVAGLLALAALNKLRLTPGVAGGNRGAVTKLRFSIAGEMAIAAFILLITATFTTMVGPPALE